VDGVLEVSLTDSSWRASSSSSSSATVAFFDAFFDDFFDDFLGAFEPPLIFRSWVYLSLLKDVLCGLRSLEDGNPAPEIAADTENDATRSRTNLNDILVVISLWS
jgi:hypothetical protein